ncbi:MAG: hypothetical protein O3C10_01740, partial [Chloroflexi bacterium]|nr:hypothetical protein [Chloroflexota bacterium]
MATTTNPGQQLASVAGRPNRRHVPPPAQSAGVLWRLAKLTATTSPKLLIFGSLAILATSVFMVTIPVLLGNAVDQAIG